MMVYIKYFICLVLTITHAQLLGQGYQLSPEFSIPVILKNDTLENAWVGGINSSTISTHDFNNDGISDVLLFDRQNNKSMVFINTAGKLKFSSVYSNQLPELSKYAIFYDYDRDGKKDIFTSTVLGIKVFRNESNLSQSKFKLFKDPVYTNHFNTIVNMDISNNDVPSLSDIDNDGDMDILHFRASQGSFLDYEKNLSMESYQKPDSLNFKNTDNCWGGFMEVSCTSYQFGYDCNANFRLQHAGGGSILAMDIDNDSDKDVVIGKEDCKNLSFLENRGSLSAPLFNRVVSFYPTILPAQQPYPLSFLEDVNGDHVKDMIVTMGNITPADTTDLKNNIWLYKNVGTNSSPVFEFVFKDFIQNSMIDLGKNTVPVAIDQDGDGDKDLLVSHSASGIKGAKLVLFKNTGTVTEPAFTVADTNYLSLMEKGYREITLTVCDLNQDEKPDLIINYLKNTTVQTLWYMNMASNGFNPAAPLTLSIPVTSLSSIFFTDIDLDGLPDAISGNTDGDLSYYRNIGNFVNPAFTLINSNYGGISSNDTYTNTHLSVFVIDLNKDLSPDLLTTDDRGKLNFYPSFQEQNPDNFISEEISISGQNKLPGKNLRFLISDFNGDNTPEAIMGTSNGGLMHFNLDSKKLGIKSDKSVSIPGFSVSPNPSGGTLKVESLEEICITICDITGKSVPLEHNCSKSFMINNLKKGVYLIHSENSANIRYFEKVIIY